MTRPNTESRTYRYFALIALFCAPMLLSAQGSIESVEIGNSVQEALGTCNFTSDPEPKPPSCNGLSDGQACVSEPLDGVGPFSYLWLGQPGQTNRCLDMVTAGTYTCRVTDLGNPNSECNVNVFIIEPPTLAINELDINAPSCFGLCDGTGDVDAFGGTGDFTYTWDSGESGENATMLCNPFTLTITDEEGCTLDTMATFADEPLPIQILPSIDSLDCFGDDNGRISVIVTDGTFPYSLDWTGPDGFVGSGVQIEDLGPGTYELIVTDDNDCVEPATFELLEPSQISLTASVSDVFCFGEETGAIDINVSGGTPGYSFSWVGPIVSLDEDLNDIPAGEYTLTVNDANGCALDTMITVSEGAPLGITASVSDISCFDEADGAIDITVDAPCLDCIYDWSGPDGFSSAATSISDLEPGDYLLQISYNGVCSTDTTISIIEPEEIILDLEASPLTCSGGDDGAIDLTVSGGVDLLTFEWSGPSGFTAATEDISDLGPGEYTVIVTDMTNCSATASLNLESPEGFTLTTTVTSVVCAGASSGAIDLEVSGGSPDYTYSWMGPDGFTAATQDLDDVPAGDYTLTVSDLALCDSTLTITIDELAGLELDELTINDLDCLEDADGAISVAIIGGTPTYTLSWSGPDGFTSDEATLTDLLPGQYALSVIDQNDCVLDTLIEVNSPDSLLGEISKTDISCFGAADGTLSVFPTGGTPDYTILWSGPDGFTSASGDLTGLTAGEYTLTLTDLNGCIYTESISILTPTEIIVDIIVTPSVCEGDDEGSISLTVSGGVPGYDFSWSGPDGFVSTDEDLTGLSDGTYTLLLTDMSGCTVERSVSLTPADAIVITIDELTDVSCAGELTGTIAISLSGGLPGYDIEWVGPMGFSSSDEDITDLAAGEYLLTVIDQQLCQKDTLITISQPTDYLILITAEDPSCAELADGSISLDISGATPLYEVDWSGPDGFSSMDEDIELLLGGVYTATITDMLGCDTTITVTLTEPQALVIDESIDDVDCHGELSGSISISISEGALPYTAQWTGPDGYTATGQVIDMLAAGEYTVVVTDDNTCSITRTYTVGTSSPILVDLEADSPSCAGGNDGLLDLTMSGGNPDYFYEWTLPDGDMRITQDIADAESGTYILVVTDLTGCSVDTTFTLSEPDPLALTALISGIACFGDSDASIEVTVSGGTPIMNFVWTGPLGFTSTDEDLIDITAGTYELNLTDANECTLDTVFTITSPTELVLTTDVTQPSCGLDNGQIEVTASGGSVAGDYDYTLLDSDDLTVSTTASTSGLGAGIYTMIVTDDNGCEARTEIELSNDNGDLTAIVTSVTCPGGMNGAIDLESEGLTGVLTTTWTGPNGFTSTDFDISGLSAGEYEVTVEDELGCLVFAQYGVGQPAAIETNAIVVDEGCVGQGNGRIDLNMTGGTPLFSFSWTGPDGFVSDEEDLTDLDPGEYDLVVTDINDCEATFSFTISAGTDLTIDGVEIDVICNGDANGAIDVTISPMVVGLSYDWTGPGGFTSDLEDLTDLGPGEYVLTVTNAEFCSDMRTFTVNEPEAIDVTIDITPSLCGDINGSAMATATGGTVAGDYGYEYTALPSGDILSTTAALGPVGAGTYALTITDDRGCELRREFSISDNSGTVEATLTSESCSGDNDGAIDLTVTDAAEPYTVGWTGPSGFTSADEDLIGLAAGEYSVTILDDNLCILTATYIIDEGLLLEVDAVITTVACDGEASGSIDITHLNGLPPYDHFWTGPNGFTSTDEDIIGIPAGPYTLNYSDASGCSAEEEYIVTSNAPLGVTVTINPINCFGGDEGSIDITITGGVGPYDVSWAGPNGYSSTSQDIAGLLAGVYDLTIVDLRGCIFTESYEVIQAEEILIEIISQSNASCAENDGSVTVSAAGGAGNYSYSWVDSDGLSIESTNTLTDLGPGIYTVTVEDNALCTSSRSIQITNTEVVFEEILTEPLCDGDLNGGIEITVVGNPLAPIQIEWTDIDGDVLTTDEDLTDVGAGQYSITLVDGQDCVYSSTYDLGAPAPLALTSQDTDVACNGDDSGAIDLQASGGTPEYDYDWVGPDGFVFTDEDPIDLVSGIYDLTLTDDNGCTATFSTEISQPFAIAIDAVVTNALCVGVDDGSILLNSGGGTGELDYQWSGPDGFTSIQQDIVNLAPGEYQLNVMDDNMCLYSETFEVFGGQVMSSTINTTGVNCFGDTNGSIQVNTEGGVPTYFYAWTGPDGFTSAQDDIDGLAPGEYILITEDDLGCLLSDTVIVIEPEALEVVELLDDPDCAAEPSGSIDITVSGGTPEYDFAWTFDSGTTSTDEDLVALPAGTYTLVITDANDCTTNAQYELDSPDAITLTLDELTASNCAANAEGAISVTPQGGDGALTVSWVGPSGESYTDEDLIGLLPGLYTATVTDGAGCSYEETFIITADNDLLAEAGNSTGACAGTEIILDASASIAAETYRWTDASGLLLSQDPVFSTIATEGQGLFILEVINGNCSDIDTLSVIVRPNPMPDAGEDIEGFFEDEIRLGGNPTSTTEVTYDWQPESLINGPNDIADPLITLQASTQFIVSVEDEFGCLGSDIIEIVLVPSVAIPDGFSPNGDEFNNTWNIGNSNQFPMMNVTVVNRWGETVFESNGYGAPWNGRYEDIDVPVGTYYYVIELNDPRFPDALTGPLTIFR